MRLVFLCGSMEEGKDGVGDYTRVLAIQLIKQGHNASVVAFDDRHVYKELAEQQKINSETLSVFRFPSFWSQGKKIEHLKDLIKDLNPDIISIQFVIYSYHNRGLPFGLNMALKKICGDTRCHIMFHELWIGFTKISPLKHKITGYFQRKILVSIVKSLNPDIITTTNKLYQCILEDNKIEASILPLFSNIQVATRNESFVAKLFNDAGILPEKIYNSFLIGIFGNLSAESDVENLLAEQVKIAEDLNKEVLFISFGKVNSTGLNELNRVEAKFSGRVKFLYLGEQCSKIVSQLMQLLDVGFSGTPSQHIGKSGVFAALKLHGVKVIVPKGDIIPEYQDRIQHYNEELMKRPASDWSVDYIANHFSRLLQAKLK